MEHLKEKLNTLIEELSEDKQEVVRDRLDNLVSVYPFNEYEYIISSLMGFGKISLDDYYEIRDDYISRNMFLYIFEIAAPRTFGEMWAQGHLRELEQEFIKPNKETDANYSGQYDLGLPHEGNLIKVEVKASRAVDAKSKEPLFVKALSSDSDSPFWMNFQQIKPACADVFIWVAVWRDVIKYWVLSSKEVEGNKYYSKGQHRGNTGEGQLHIKDDNIEEFNEYLVKPSELKKAVISAYSRQKAE